MELTLREKFIILVNNDRINKSDAIVFLEGDGYNRLDKVVQLYNAGYASKIVFSGGITDYSYGSFPFMDIYQKLIDLGIPDSVIIHESKSLNTREQAIEVLKLAQDQNWNRLILVASHYHQYRAYLTFLKIILDSKLNIALYNAPCRDLNWFEENEWGRRIELLEDEFIKIKEYSLLSHLATFNEAIKYQKWKEQQVY